MTIALTFARRRLLGFSAASVLLHAMVLGWAGAELGPEPDQDSAAVQPMMALLLAPPVALATAPPSAPQATRPAASAPVPVPPGVAAAAPLPLPLDAIATAALAQIEVAADVLAELAPVPTPTEAPAAPRLRVDLPPSTRLKFDVTRKDKGGTEWSGASETHWQRTGESSRLSMEASVNMLVTRVNVGKVVSEGALTQDGIAPRRVLEKRMGRAETATHFNAGEGRITFSAREQGAALLPGAQDKASVLFQLAAIARADSAQLKDGVEIQVGSERDAAPYRFVVAGEEDLDTPLGSMATWRLTRPPLPGSYNARLDIWLAPQHGWLPVKVRSLEANGAVTTQTIREIVATGSANDTDRDAK